MQSTQQYIPAKTIVVLYGLPGSGKTTFAKKLQRRFDCPWFNADKVRSTLCKDLDFSAESRIEQARRLGCIAALTLEHGSSSTVLVDFVNPTVATFETFRSNTWLPNKKTPKNNDAEVPRSFKQATADAEFPTYNIFSIYMNTIEASQSRFPDTAALFQPALSERLPNLIVTQFVDAESTWKTLTEYVFRQVRAVESPSWPRLMEFKDGAFHHTNKEA